MSCWCFVYQLLLIRCYAILLSLFSVHLYPLWLDVFLCIIECQFQHGYGIIFTMRWRLVGLHRHFLMSGGFVEFVVLVIV